MKVDTKYLILEVDECPEVEPRGASRRVMRVRRGKQGRNPGKPKTVLTLNRSVACTVDGPPKFRTVTMCGRFKYWIVKIKPAFRYTDVNVNRDTFTLHIIYANASPRVGTVSTGAKANCKYWILLQA